MGPTVSGADLTPASLQTEATLAARALRALGARAVSADDPEYPPGFRALRDPPAVVFARGDALPAMELAVAVVGARAATLYGLSMASRLSSDLARLGFTVVSGLARGVDAAAHRGALDAGGTTVAVLPSGLDRVTPSHHRDLAEAIAARGTLVTELARGGPRFRGEFVRRNRLIAAMSVATVVVEAALGGGALTTAAVARALGRPVLAVPGDADRPTARGTNDLLRAGALPCEGVADVVRAIEAGCGRGGAGVSAPGGEGRMPTALRKADGGRPVEARLLEALGERPLPLEEVAARAGLGLPETLAGLLALQWAGIAVPWPGQRWGRAAG
jgi:DNA processing protein